MEREKSVERDRKCCSNCEKSLQTDEYATAIRDSEILRKICIQNIYAPESRGEIGTMFSEASLHSIPRFYEIISHAKSIEIGTPLILCSNEVYE